jgi:hypothetical protein
MNGMMMISIEGLLAPKMKSSKSHKYLFEQFLKHLKILRDNPKNHNEFFSV